MRRTYQHAKVSLFRHGFAYLSLAFVLLSGVVAALPLSTHNASVKLAAQQFSQPCGNAGTPTATHHVIWIFMENESYNTVIGNTANAPYQNQLASQCGVPTNMYAESHGSLVNYMSATNGLSITDNSQYTTHNDCSPNTTFCYSNTPSIFSQIDGTAGESWKGYAEDMPSNCSKTDSGNYAVRHNPAAYYTGLSDCSQFDVPMGSASSQTGAFYSDVANGTLPSFSFISPNLIDDAHSSSTATGDAWLSQIIPTITSGANYQSGDTTIFITNDEGGAGSDHVIGEDCANQSLAPSQPSCHIPTIVISPYTKAGTQDGTFYTHYSMLRTTEELLGLPLLGQAATANSMTAAFNLSSTTTPPPVLQPVTNLAATAVSSTQINLSWTASASASNYTVLRNGASVGTVTGTTFNDTGLTPTTAYNYSVVANDSAGDSAGSNTVSATTQAASTTTQWVADQSLETDLTGWTGVYNSTSKSSRVAGGYDGSWSLRSVNSSSATAANGFVDKPHWIDGSSGKATVSGTVYTGSVWVKPDAVGQKIALYLRELNSAGTVLNKAPYNQAVTITATSTNWVNLTDAYTAVGTGDSLNFYVYATNSTAGQGFNADLLSLTSPGGGSTADTTPPTAPTNFVAIPTSQTQIDLQWKASTDNIGVTGYNVLRNGVSIGTTTSTSFSDTGLSANTAYNYSVLAFDAANNLSPAATTSASTPPVLGTPGNVQATTPSTTEIDLSWTAATGADSYTIMRDGSAIGVTQNTTYADTGLTAGTTYNYSIVATDEFDDSAASNVLPVTTPTTTTPPPPPPTLSLCGNTTPATVPAIKHVLVVMLENLSYNKVVGSANAPYQTSLKSSCGVATAMFGATHASAANYLAVSSGEYSANSPSGCGSVKACSDASDNLYHQLDTAGLSWRNYLESMPTACSPTTSGSYKIGHNPAIFYSDIPSAECKANDLPVADLTAQSGSFWTDLQNQTLPSFSFITPNENDDGEGSGGAAAALMAADTWTKNFLATVQQSNSYQAGNTLILITYDEGAGSDSKTGEDCTNMALDLPVTNGVSAHQDSCHLPFFVVYPYTPAGTADGTFFDHYSVTKTVETIFGLPFLAHANDSQTTSLNGHFGIK